jgi:hypothetical protein
MQPGMSVSYVARRDGRQRAAAVHQRRVAGLARRRGAHDTARRRLWPGHELPRRAASRFAFGASAGHGGYAGGAGDRGIRLRGWRLRLR